MKTIAIQIMNDEVDAQKLKRVLEAIKSTSMNRQYHQGKYYDYASFLVSVEEVEGETFDEWVKAKLQSW